MQGLVGHRKDLGFYPERGGTPGGLGTKQRCALTQMFTGAPWLLWQRTDCGLEGASQGPGEEETHCMAKVSHDGWGLDQGGCPGSRQCQILDNVEGGASKPC